ncbi:type II toxin-antitoxin system RelE family toxin [Calidifontibacillus oryziterrae]|uniref:type II toxin-antitoxin system RelE family toxin n=1 Tax=Calidifontibacillus oryziterrae TaxID=1191699 RepID=UPI001375B460
MDRLQTNPYTSSNIKKLKGSEHDEYRCRFGDFRIIYRIVSNELVILVLYIGPRGDIYKKYR